MERTLVLIKPDGVKRGLIGDIISFYEKKGIEIEDLKMLRASKDLAEKHYEEHKGRPYFDALINYIIEGKLCALVLKGENIIEIVRRVNGDKEPLKADMGSIRGRFACEKTRNLVHASDSIENAKREINIWFPELE